MSGAGFIVGGHNRDDMDVFRDVSPSFFRNLERALLEGSAILRGNRLRIVRPLSRKSKVEVIRLAAALDVPLGLTWSCHRDGEKHCWKCSGCLSRRRSFQGAGIHDPLDETSWTKIT